MGFRWTSLMTTLFVMACGPAVKTAGHSLSAHETSEKIGSERRPSSAQSESKGEVVASPPLGQPPAPDRKALFADVPEGGRLIGTDGPVALEGLGRGGHWVAHCSLPKGSKVGVRGEGLTQPALHLTLGEKSEPIDALLAVDESGRYLVVLVGERAWLIDALEGARFDLSELSPDLRHDRLPDHRSFAFTSAGLVMLSTKEESAAYFLPFSSLDDQEALSLGAESSNATSAAISSAIPVDLGKGKVWRLLPGERSFSVMVLPEGATEASWPVPAVVQPTKRCRAPSGPYDAYERLSSFRPDASITYRWGLTPPGAKLPAKLETTQAPGFVGLFDDGWVRREDSGRLLLVRGKTQEQIASARCGARILRADEESGFFLVACEEYSPVLPKKSDSKEKPKYRFDLYLIRPGAVFGLRADIARTGVDYFGPPAPSLFPIRPGALAALVDFDKKKLFEIEGDVQVLATSAEKALLRRANRVTLWSGKGEVPVDVTFSMLDSVLINERAIALGSTMLLLQEDPRTWNLPGPPLAISAEGYALIPKKAAAPHAWPEGPLLLVRAPGAVLQR